MAGVEVVAPVFNVIKLAEATIRGCQRIVRAIRDAPKELRVLILLYLLSKPFFCMLNHSWAALLLLERETTSRIKCNAHRESSRIWTC